MEILDPELTSLGTSRDKLMDCIDLSRKSCRNSSEGQAPRARWFGKHFPKQCQKSLPISVAYFCLCAQIIELLLSSSCVNVTLKWRSHKTGHL